MEILNVKTNRAIIMLVLTILLIVGRDIFFLQVPMIVFTVVTIIASVFTDRSGRFLFVIAMLPFCRGIPYSEMILVTLLIEFIKIDRSFSLKINVKLYLPILCIIAIELIGYAVFNVLSNEIIYLTVYMLFITYAIDQKVYERKEEKYLITYSLTTLVSVFIVVIREMNLYSLDYIMTYNVRFGANTNGLIVTNYNANELGLYCSIAIAVLLMMQLQNKKKSLLVLAIFISIVGIVSISRTYLLVLLIIWTIYLISKESDARSVLFLGIVMLLAIFFINRFFPEMSQWIIRYYETRNSQVFVDNFGGRSTILAEFCKKSFGNIYTILFGYSELYSTVIKGGGAHNGIQEIIISWGIVGFCVIMFWLYSIIHSASKISGKPEKMAYFPLIIFLLFIQTIQFFTMHNYLLIMLVSIIAISYKKSDILKGEKYGKRIKKID